MVIKMLGILLFVEKIKFYTCNRYFCTMYAGVEGAVGVISSSTAFTNKNGYTQLALE